MEVGVKIKSLITLFGLALLVGVAANASYAQQPLKIGYINSNAILEKYKEAADVRKQLAELNSQWEQEARNMQKEIQTLQEQLESQSLLLSEERKVEKQQEIQNKYLEYQQFLQQKWNPQGGEAVKKEAELLKPVFDKINEAIKKIGDAQSFHYIFDTVNANLLYASDDQPDLTEQVLAELDKGLPKQSNAGGN